MARSQPVQRRGDRRTASTVSMGVACGSAPRGVPAGPAYTLCVVSPYPGGAPDEFLDGQALVGFDWEAQAITACRRYARDPASLPPFNVPGAALLVVNDRDGNEVCRQPLLGVTCG
jgi:hypothetical protein